MSKFDYLTTRIGDLIIRCAAKLPASQKPEEAACEVKRAFTRYLEAKGKSDEEYEAMEDCLCCMSTLLAENENLRKEREELKERLKGGGHIN